MSGAEALPLYYDNGRNPLGVLALARGVLHRRQLARLQLEHRPLPLLQPERPVREDLRRAGNRLPAQLRLGDDVRRDDAAARRRRRPGRPLRRRRQRLARRRHERRTSSSAASGTTCSRPTTTSTRRGSRRPSPTASLCSLLTADSSSSHEASNLCDDAEQHPVLDLARPRLQPEQRPRRVRRGRHARHRLQLLHGGRGRDDHPARAGAEVRLRPERERHRRPARLRHHVRRHRIRRRGPRHPDREHRDRPARRRRLGRERLLLPVGRQRRRHRQHRPALGRPPVPARPRARARRRPDAAGSVADRGSTTTRPS